MKWHPDSTSWDWAHLEEFLGLSFLLPMKPWRLSFYIFNKTSFYFFFYAAVGTSLGSGRQTWEGRRELALTWKRQTDRWDTWVVWQLESATAEVSLPLLLHIFFQGAVENKYEEAWKQTDRVILPQQTCWQVKITAWVTLQLSPLHKPAL